MSAYWDWEALGFEQALLRESREVTREPHTETLVRGVEGFAARSRVLSRLASLSTLNGELARSLGTVRDTEKLCKLIFWDLLCCKFLLFSPTSLSRSTVFFWLCSLIPLRIFSFVIWLTNKVFTRRPVTSRAQDSRAESMEGTWSLYHPSGERLINFVPRVLSLLPSRGPWEQGWKLGHYSRISVFKAVSEAY